jgi:hypothetical protein
MNKPTICDENGEREMTDAEYEHYLIVTAEPAPAHSNEPPNEAPTADA